MMRGMDGPHVFVITVKSNDADEPEMKLEVRADFQPMDHDGPAH